jgi:hypothetical protein
MAKYMNRDVVIDSYPTEEYKVTIVHEDTTKETVPLSKVTLNRKEAAEFIKHETAKHEQYSKTKDVEAKTVSMNPFSRKAAL